MEEFLAATLGKDIYMDEKKIIDAFEMFDKVGGIPNLLGKHGLYNS